MAKINFSHIVFLFFFLKGFISIGQIYSNGNLSTGNLSLSGTAAPTGYTWSEMQNNTGNTTEVNATGGFPGFFYSNGTVSYRLADDFIVPAGKIWNITSFDFFAYQADYTDNTIPVNQLKVQIFNVNPSTTSGATPIAGNMTTNVLDVSGSSDALIYRIFNSLYPFGGEPINFTRKLWKLRGTLSASLPPGTYWVEYQVHSASDLPIYFMPVTIVGSRGVTGANSKVHTVASNYPTDVIGWSSNIDGGSPASAPNVAQDLAFNINGSVVLGLDYNDIEKNIVLYPNPTKNSFNISISNNLQISAIEIIDISSRIVKTIELTNETAFNLNIEDLTSGNYFVRIKTDAGLVTKRLIKQ